MSQHKPKAFKLTYSSQLIIPGSNLTLSIYSHIICISFSFSGCHSQNSDYTAFLCFLNPPTWRGLPFDTANTHRELVIQLQWDRHLAPKYLLSQELALGPAHKHAALTQKDLEVTAPANSSHSNYTTQHFSWVYSLSYNQCKGTGCHFCQQMWNTLDLVLQRKVVSPQSCSLLSFILRDTGF